MQLKMRTGNTIDIPGKTLRVFKRWLKKQKSKKSASEISGIKISTIYRIVELKRTTKPNYDKVIKVVEIEDSKKNNR